MKLRIKSNNGRLECEYSDSEIKPYYTSEAKQQAFYYPKDLEQFESSFKPIQLSVSAEKYLLNEFGSYLYVSTPKELSPTECEVFEVKKRMQWKQPDYYELHLKELVSPSTELIEHEQDDDFWEQTKLEYEYANSWSERDEYFFQWLKSKFHITLKS